MRLWSDAACLNHDTELFFPTASVGREADDQARAAKEICAQCPVRIDCLRQALTWGVSDGVWGGLTAYERSRLALSRS